MEIPNICKGYLYPSSRVNRCPRFHMCIVSKKCQNFDRHNLECAVCESRVDVPEDQLPKGGYLPEGEHMPDIQDAIHTLEMQIHKAMAHPDAETQTFDQYDITNKMKKERQAADVLAHFMNTAGTMEEKTMHAMVDPSLRKLLGRMD